MECKSHSSFFKELCGGIFGGCVVNGPIFKFHGLFSFYLKICKICTTKWGPKLHQKSGLQPNQKHHPKSNSIHCNSSESLKIPHYSKGQKFIKFQWMTKKY
jgi:hypothetical protein